LKNQLHFIFEYVSNVYGRVGRTEPGWRAQLRGR